MLDLTVDVRHCFDLKIHLRKKISSGIIYRYTCSNYKVTYYGKTFHHFYITFITADNYKSASGQLQNSGKLQNNSVNVAMLTTINRVINTITDLKNQIIVQGVTPGEWEFSIIVEGVIPAE